MSLICRGCYYILNLHSFWEDNSWVNTLSMFITSKLWVLLLMFCFYCFSRYGGGMSSAKAALESDTRVWTSVWSRAYFLLRSQIMLGLQIFTSGHSLILVGSGLRSRSKRQDQSEYHISRYLTGINLLFIRIKSHRN